MIEDSINIVTIQKSKRLNASFYLSEAEVYERRISKYQVLSLRNLTEDIFTAGRSKRNYCHPSKGIPFLGNTDISSINPIEGCKYVSTKHWREKKGLIKDGMILTGRVGQNTVGAYAYSNKILNGCIGSDNVIRIIPNDIVKSGYLYSYLSSKFGYVFSRKHISGNAQPFVTEEMLSTIPVPIFPIEKQLQIHNFITESAKLREDSYIVLEAAIKLFENRIGTSNVSLSSQYDKVNINKIQSFLSRIDAQYQIITQKLDAEHYNSLEYRKISTFAKRIFVGNRAKRNYVENGIPFLSSSDMVLFNPKRYAKQISHRTPSLNNLLVNRNDILISRSGTVGNVVMVGEDLKNSAVSEHALRLEIDDSKIAPEYIFCYLKTKQGKMYMEASAFGSVIITLNEDLIGNIDVPMLTKDDRDFIVSKIKTYIEKLDLATLKENQAIQLVENEIEQWQN